MEVLGFTIGKASRLRSLYSPLLSCCSLPLRCLVDYDRHHRVRNTGRRDRAERSGSTVVGRSSPPLAVPGGELRDSSSAPRSGLRGANAGGSRRWASGAAVRAPGITVAAPPGTPVLATGRLLTLGCSRTSPGRLRWALYALGAPALLMPLFTGLPLRRFLGNPELPVSGVLGNPVGINPLH